MNISVAEPPKQCCLYANETIVKDVVRYLHAMQKFNFVLKKYLKRLTTLQFWTNVIFSTLTTNCGIFLQGKIDLCNISSFNHFSQHKWHGKLWTLVRPVLWANVSTPNIFGGVTSFPPSLQVLNELTKRVLTKDVGLGCRWS